MKLETTTWFRTILVLAVLFCIGYGICLLSRDDEIAKTLSGIALISTGVFCFVWSLFPASSGICDILPTTANAHKMLAKAIFFTLPIFYFSFSRRIFQSKD